MALMTDVEKHKEGMAKFNESEWLEKYFDLKINIEANGVIIKGVNDPETLAKKKEAEEKAQASNSTDTTNSTDTANSTRLLQAKDFSEKAVFNQKDGILTVTIKTKNNTDLPVMRIGVKTNKVALGNTTSPDDTLIMSKTSQSFNVKTQQGTQSSIDAAKVLDD
jgi:hypothetical protein